MSHKVVWKRSEIEIIINNYADCTTKELVDMLPGRSEKAINRKIEKLRDDGKIGHRTDETVKRSYIQREAKMKSENTKRRGRSRSRLPVDDDYEPLE